MKKLPNSWQNCDSYPARYDFESYPEQALRHRLVCGICEENIQCRLLAEADLSLVRALELAQGMDVANRNAKSLKSTKTTAVHKMNTKRTQTLSPCYRCGQPNHDLIEDCRFHDAVCHHCAKKGNIAPTCRSKQKGTTPKCEKISFSKKST